ncbi:DUF5677 domain-containing protein [Plesiomonas shigelloides]|uniref:DUF5677 domain-containing protein n=1 Tax=Plesiomonas shigelloides TaxID=703 RepID=UPI0030BF9DE5
MDKLIKEYSSVHFAHLEHISKLSEVVDTLSELSRQLDIDAISSYLIPKIQIDYLIRSSVEIINSLKICTVSKHFSSVEALSRISLEMSVNLRLLIRDDVRDTSKSLVRSYLKSKESTIKKWLKFSEKENDKEAQACANTILSSIYNLKKIIPWVEVHGKDTWPKTIRDKFTLVGEEGMYLTAFASASDSVHSLSEDIFNLTIIAVAYPEDPAEHLDAINAEKASFSIYLYILAISFYFNTLSALIDKFDLKVNEDEIEKCFKTLNAVKDIHHNDFNKYKIY